MLPLHKSRVYPYVDNHKNASTIYRVFEVLLVLAPHNIHAYNPLPCDGGDARDGDLKMLAYTFPVKVKFRKVFFKAVGIVFRFPFLAGYNI